MSTYSGAEKPLGSYLKAFYLSNPNAMSKETNLVIGLIITTVSAGLGIWWSIGYFSHNASRPLDKEPITSLIAIGLVASLGVLIGVVKLFSAASTIKVVVFEHGFSLEHGRTRKTFAWNQVKMLKITHEDGAKRYWLHRRDGFSFAFDSKLVNGSDLGEYLLAEAKSNKVSWKDDSGGGSNLLPEDENVGSLPNGDECYASSDVLVCPLCGSPDLEPNGHRSMVDGMEKIRCTACSHELEPPRRFAYWLALAVVAIVATCVSIWVIDSGERLPLLAKVVYLGPLTVPAVLLWGMICRQADLPIKSSLFHKRNQNQDG